MPIGACVALDAGLAGASQPFMQATSVTVQHQVILYALTLQSATQAGASAASLAESAAASALASRRWQR